MSKGIEERAKFDKIRYANCWEDPKLLLEVFFPLLTSTGRIRPSIFTRKSISYFSNK